MKLTRSAAVFALSSVMAVGSVCAVELKTTEQKVSYVFGLQIGQQMAQEGVELDVAAFSEAISDVLNKKMPQLDQNEIQAALNAYQQERQAKTQAAAAGNQKEGDEFLATNKTKPGVKVTPSGLQYKIVTPGTGKHPAATSTVVVNYRGTLINGTEFDSSYKRGTPATFPVNQVIQGWQEGIPLMKEGAKWELYIPSDLAYGPAGTPSGIGPNSTLIFEVELLEVK